MDKYVQRRALISEDKQSHDSLSPQRWRTRCPDPRFELSTGSSPRAWGTHTSERRLRRHLRFIPMSVGNTVVAVGWSTRCPVHPHGRGEHLQLKFILSSANGSSPRAWGTHQDSLRSEPLSRFTPTGVGNTLTSMTRKSASAVHPHGRGEHKSQAQVCASSSGSSPRAWGTPGLFRNYSANIRFIPTGVGNTAEEGI